MFLFGPPNIGKMKARGDIDGLVRALGHKDEVIRREAAQALVEIGESAVDSLIAALEDNNNNVRIEAAILLGKIKDARAVEPLIGMLKDRDFNMRAAAATSLGEIRRKPAVKPLIAALRDETMTVRANAARALEQLGWEPKSDRDRMAFWSAQAWAALFAVMGKIGSLEAGLALMQRSKRISPEDDFPIKQLVDALNSSNAEVRKATAEILGRFSVSAPWAVEALINALGDGNDAVRQAAMTALVQVGKAAVEPLIPALRDSNSKVRRAAAIALGQIGDPRAVEPLIVTFKGSDNKVRQAVVEALGKIKAPHAVELLIAALKDSDSEVRQAAVWALDQLGWKPGNDEDAALYWAQKVEALIIEPGYLKDSVRKNAAEALIKIGAPVVVPLIAVLQDCKRSSCVHRTVAEVLGAIGDARAVESLIAALKDEDVREAAARALGAIGDPRAVKPLIAALRDGGKYARQAAAEALVKIGAPSVEPLIAALRDRDEDVRRAAAEALDKLGWQPARDDDNAAWYWMAKLEWEKCIGLGAIAVEPLIAALRYGGENVRGAAAKALVKIGAPSVDPFIAALRDGGENVRQAAAVALGEIGDARAVEPLIVALRDIHDNVRWIAANALDRLGWQPAQDENAAWYWIAKLEWEKSAAINRTITVEELIRRLESAHDTTRWSSAAALGKLCDPRAVGPLITALWDKEGRVRRESARALVKLYQQGNISQEDRQRILAVRNRITQPHKDSHVDTSCTDAHTDEGIGVDFPL